MWAALGAKILKALIGEILVLIPKGIKALTGYFARKKQIKESQEAAERIENENNSEVIRNSADDLP